MNKQQNNIYQTLRELENKSEDTTLNVDLYGGDGHQIHFTLEQKKEDLIYSVWVYFEGKTIIILHKRECENQPFLNKTIRIETTRKDLKTFSIDKNGLKLTVNGLNISN